uniref:Variant surface glycoprotein 1125.1104 n=1 Tax=Trypanosoma brucei TaxID=5691 RepID=A0A1J0R692_9TRYP|nr:variant surface glycoprotein 1125.1104 [Trypanosoma brucei]
MEVLMRSVWRMGFLLALLTQAKATHNAFDETAVKKLCNLATSLQNAAGVATKKLVILADAAQAAEATRTKLLIEALTTKDNGTALLFAAAAVQVDSCARSTTAKLKEHIPKALAATTKASMGAGALTSFVEMLHNMTDASNRKCISSGAGTATRLLQDPTKQGCPAYSIESPADVTGFNAAHIKATGFTEFAASTISLIFTGDNNCGFLKGGGGTAKTDLWGGAATAIIGGLIDITGDSGNSAAAAVKKADDIANNFGPTGTLNTMAKKLMQAIATINSIQEPTCPAAEEQQLDHLLNPENLKPHLTTTLKGLKRQAKGKEEQQITALINKVAGKNSEQATQLKAKLSKTNGKTLENENPVLKPLSQLGGDEGLAVALLHAISEVKTAAAPVASCDEPDKGVLDAAAEKQIKDCSTKEEAECKGECVLVEGVCAPKKKGEGENEEKLGKLHLLAEESNKENARRKMVANGKEKSAKIIIFS